MTLRALLAALWHPWGGDPAADYLLAHPASQALLERVRRGDLERVSTAGCVGGVVVRHAAREKVG